MLPQLPSLVALLEGAGGPDQRHKVRVARMPGLQAACLCHLCHNLQVVWPQQLVRWAHAIHRRAVHVAAATAGLCRALGSGLRTAAAR